MAKKKEEIIKSKLEETLERLNKTYGVGSVLSLDSKSTGVYDVISTGSIGFDYITLGVGGVVKGKLYELKGWQGAGKSTICGHLTAECQKKGGKVLYIDGEHAVDKNYFEKLGVDISKMLISQPSCGEEGFNIAMEMIATNEIDLVIIDSDSSLIPKKVLDGEVGDSSIGKKALLNSNAYPKLKGALSKHKVAVVVISQYREKIGVMFGNPTTTQGGHALKFYSDCIIEVTKSEAKDGDQIYGGVTKLKSTKNKMCAPYMKSEFEIIYGQGIDTLGEIMQLASDFELVKKWGKSITHKDIKYDEKDFRELLVDNPEFYNSLRQEIIDNIKGIKEEEEEEEELKTLKEETNESEY